jgi:glycosyltransferase involved in cell wall biosynthesis
MLLSLDLSRFVPPTTDSPTARGLEHERRSAWPVDCERRLRPVRILRVIARLNVGGPSIQAITLTQRMDELGYRTRLLRGTEAQDEGNMDYLAERLGVRPVLVRSLRRAIGPHDALALGRVWVEIVRTRPDVLHTHAAKAGSIARLAALLSGPFAPRVRVHTFHGHVLTGYFSPRAARVFQTIERFLARHTDRLVAVSPEVRDDLVDLGIAPSARIEVLPLGFDLAAFDLPPAERARYRRTVREELGIPETARLVTLVARLVPIKRVDRFLRVAARLADMPGVAFLIVGDGELREEVRALPAARALGERLVWAGFRRDLPAVLAATDVAVLTSDNEGTPVSLIEAQAASVPVVSTAVGGTASVIEHGRTGLLAPPEDEEGIARAVRGILVDRDLADRLRAAGRESSLARFSIERLCHDIDDLYRRMLDHAG